MDLDAQFFDTSLRGQGAWKGPRLEGTIKRFSQDSRILGHGDCFVALETESRDGHDFIESAVARGARAALVSRFQDHCSLPQYVVDDSLQGLQSLASAHRARFSGRVIGVTGSAGKTSTKDLLATLLGESVCATEGNFNNTIGVPLSVLRLTASDSFGVFEAGIDRPTEMDVLASIIAPDLGIVTLVAEAHLDRLGSLQGVAEEKVKMLRAVKPGGLTIFPDTCLKYPQFNDIDNPAWVVTRNPNLCLKSGQQMAAHYWIEDSEGEHDSLLLCVEGPEEISLRLFLPRMSEGMIRNAVMAILAATHLGVSSQNIQSRLNSWEAGERRGQWTQSLGRAVFVDCYNANPASMLDSARFFDESTSDQNTRTFVIGTMNELGSGSAEMHREVAAQIPLRKSDVVACVGEFAHAIAAGVSERAENVTDILVFSDVEKLVDDWVRFRGPIFLKGSRGLKLERLLDLDEERRKTIC